MSNFTTDLFWRDGEQPALPEPALPLDRQPEKREDVPAPAARVENPNERLQQVAGNAALAREAEEAKAAREQLAEAARRPAKVLAQKPEATPPEKTHPENKRKDEGRAKASTDPKAPSADRTQAAEKLAAEKAAAAEAQHLSEATKEAAARAAKLAQVLASFDQDAGKADLLALAQLTETGPPGIAEEIARTLALAVMRADPEQRAAIAERIKDELGHRRDMRLAIFLTDRLAWLAVTSARPAPPPPPPPAPPE